MQHRRTQTRTVLALIGAAATIAAASGSPAGPLHAPVQHSNAIAVTTVPYTHATRSATLAATPHVNSAAVSSTTGPQACAQLDNVQTTAGAGYTAAQIATAYDLNPFYEHGDTGAGQTIAMLELEPNSTADIAAFQSCYSTTTTVNYTQVDGGAGTGPGSGEAALDIEQAIATAPGATIDVYQAPNTVQGVIDAYQAMVQNPVTTIISTSWGGCEPNSGPLPAAEATIFQQAVSDHITILAAAGDNGSTDCGTSSLSVDDPASNPNVTAVGGTSLPNYLNPVSQTVYNDSSVTAGAGGGGVSQLWAMPAWQTNLATGAYQAAAADGNTVCATPSDGGCRTIPDVSADADPYTGYWIIHTDPSTGQQDAQLYGGTSAAAPLWAGIVALTNASANCNNQPVGYLNPALYKLAGTGSYLTALTDITTGNNNYAPDSPVNSDYNATTGYDLATGLGTPNGYALAQALCAAGDTVTLATPGAQTATVGQPTTITLNGSDSDGHPLTYAAVDLPQGLTLNTATGQITGTPAVSGQWQVTVTAIADSTGVRQSVTFPLTVTDPATTTTPAPGATSGQSGGGETTSSATPAPKPLVLTRRIDGQLLTITIPPTTVRSRTLRILYATHGRVRIQQTTLRITLTVHGHRRTYLLRTHGTTGQFAIRQSSLASINAITIIIRYQPPGPRRRARTTQIALTPLIHRDVARAHRTTAAAPASRLRQQRPESR